MKLWRGSRRLRQNSVWRAANGRVKYCLSCVPMRRAGVRSDATLKIPTLRFAQDGAPYRSRLCNFRLLAYTMGVTLHIVTGDASNESSLVFVSARHARGADGC